MYCIHCGRTSESSKAGFLKVDMLSARKGRVSGHECCWSPEVEIPVGEQSGSRTSHVPTAYMCTCISHRGRRAHTSLTSNHCATSMCHLFPWTFATSGSGDRATRSYLKSVGTLSNVRFEIQVQKLLRSPFGFSEPQISELQVWRVHTSRQYCSLDSGYACGAGW